MTAEELAQTVRDWLDGEYDDGHEVFMSASAEGASVVIEVGAEGEPSRRFRAVLVEIEEGA